MQKKFLSTFLVFVMLIGMAVYAVPAAADDLQAEMSFSDVSSSRWSYDNIRYAVEKGYMNGIGNSKFDPAGDTSRAMVVTVLWRANGAPEMNFEEKFEDVPDGKWYTDAVLWAESNGIVNGMSKTVFAPDTKITREQLATILYRYADFDYVITDGVASDISIYSDSGSVSAYAKDAMSWANATGLIKGMTDSTLEPKGSATREQFAAIMYRYDTNDGFEYQTVYNEPVLRSTYTEKEYPLVTDADIYVSTDGDDTNPGTFENPVKTFERARDLVRELKQTATDEITVAFMAGEYGNLQNLTLDSDDSGSEAVPVRYCKYGDGDVIFSNGISWNRSDFSELNDEEKTIFPKDSADMIMKLSLDKYFPEGMPEGLSIFGENGPIWEARYPNKNDSQDSYLKNMMKVLTDEPNVYDMTVQIIPPLSTRILTKLNSYENVKVTGYIMYGWRVDTFYIKSFDKNTGLLTFDETKLPEDFYQEAHGIRTPQMMLDEIYISNSPDLIDTSGEYWYDRSSNTIYIFDPEESYSIGLNGRFITLSEADYITLEGLTFLNNTDNTIQITNSEHVSIRNCDASGVYSVIAVSGKSDYLTVQDCEFSRFIGFAVQNHPVTHRASLESNHILIDNNYIHDYGLSTIFNNQAIMDSAIGTVISHNIFRNSANGAVNLGTLSIIEYNVFDNMMTSTQDFGIIYTWYGITNRRNEIRYNLFSNMQNNGATYGLYMDDFTQDQYIYGNIFYRCGACGVMLHNARDEYVYDNLFIESAFNTNGFGYYENGTVQEGILPDGTGWSYLYDRYYRDRINEGQEGYEIWKETFPTLYAYTPDTENTNDRTSIFCPWNSIHNNLFVNKGNNVADVIKSVGDVHDNITISSDENQYFVNPAHGDYTLKDGVGFFYIPFEKIGRY